MSIGDVTVSAAVAWVIAAAAAFATIFKAIEILKSLRKSPELSSRIKKHDELLDNDNRRIGELEDAIKGQQKAQAVMFRALLSQINHELTGNSVDNLRAARDEIQAFLTNR